MQKVTETTRKSETIGGTSERTARAAFIEGTRAATGVMFDAMRIGGAIKTE